jgi:hypothetical protein
MIRYYEKKHPLPNRDRFAILLVLVDGAEEKF